MKCKDCKKMKMEIDRRQENRIQAIWFLLFSPIFFPALFLGLFYQIAVGDGWSSFCMSEEEFQERRGWQYD